MRPGRTEDAQEDLPRLTDRIANEIRTKIISGELKDGERLPPLNALVEQYGLSSPSMREVLRVLEAEGLIAVQRGAIGGSIVRRPTHETAAYSLALAMAAAGTEMGDLREALSLIEPACAVMCARRRNRGLIRQLRAVNATARAAEDNSQALWSLIHFHIVLTQQCGNRTMTLAARALGAIFVANEGMYAPRAAPRTSKLTDAQREEEIGLHERVTDLIEARDETGVFDAMLDHTLLSHRLGGVQAKSRVGVRPVHLRDLLAEPTLPDDDGRAQRKP